MPDATRRVLVLAYFFPPLGGAGVQRTLKFVRYLPEHGYAPIVITTRSRAYPARDERLLGEVPPEVPVIRAFDPPFARWAVMLFDKLGLDSLRAVAGWPDDALAWAPGALVQALRAIRRYRPAVILSTSAPFTAHFVAYAVHRLTGTPWVADFRDEWSTNPYLADQPRVLRALARASERRIARAVRRVVVAADYFELEGLPLHSPRRITIVNGVDPADFPEPAGAPRSDRFRVSYVGTLYGHRDAAPVLRAFERLLARGAIDADRLELRIVGNVWLRPEQLVDSVPLVRTGYVEHERAVREMSDSSVLLFYAPGDSLAPSGKIYEYLASGRPILCVARRDNFAYGLVEELDAGRCAEPDDAAGVEDAILDLWERWQRTGLPDQAEVRERTLERFSRRRLTAQLAEALDAVAEGRD